MSTINISPADRPFDKSLANWKSEKRRWISNPPDRAPVDEVAADKASAIKMLANKAAANKSPVNRSPGSKAPADATPADAPPVDTENNGRARTLILCFDGTGDTFDNDNSNVVQLTSLLKKDDPTKQMVYYQTGIGTTSSADARFPFIRNTTQALDSMFAITLGAHVLDGYEFLMNQYHEGDSICIFGFSRGAYTARALAGMIQKVGLLPTGNRQQLPFAYRMFADEHDDEFCQEFKNTFSIDVKIQFVGVWDTVASVGIIPRHLPFVSSNNAIRCFRHALALDEHRAKFIPSFYHSEEEMDGPSADTEGSHTPDTPNTPITPSAPSPPSTPSTPHRGLLSAPPMSRRSSSSSQVTVIEDVVPKKCDKTQIKTDAKEVWFAGVHTDVGGGSVENKTRHSLARISLRWMIRECWRARASVIFDMDKLRDVVGLDIDEDNEWICEPPPPLEAHVYQSFLEGKISPPKPNVLQKAWNAVSSPVATLTKVISAGIDYYNGHIPLKVMMDPAPQTIYKGKLVDKKFMGEATEELFDALSPMNDQLHLALSWWFLEWLPFWTRKERTLHTNTTVPLPSLFSSPWKWVAYFKNFFRNHHFIINKGRGRKVYKHIMKRGMLVHRSVRTRLNAVDRDNDDGTYTPLVQPNIPGYTPDGRVRSMTQREWTKTHPAGCDEPWVHWWGYDDVQEKKILKDVAGVRRRRKDAKKRELELAKAQLRR